MSNQTFLKTVFVLLFLISLMGCNFSSNKNVNNSSNSQNTDTGNPDNTKPSEIIEEGEYQSIIRVPQYFWGTWQRMDNGQYYVIDENEVTFKNQNYVITSSTESSLNVNNLGVFAKQSDSVMVNNSIPYFRKGGTNLEYTMKLVGFEDDISRAAGSLNLSDFKVKGKSEKYKSFESDSNVSEDGTIKLIAPTAGDIQTITVSSESDVVAVVPGITVETKGSNMGTIPISSKGQYSLKVTGTIPDEEKDDGYLYGNNYKSYPMTITITNISDVDSETSACSICPSDENLTIISTDGSDLSLVPISTLKAGMTKTINVQVQYGNISSGYVDIGLNITITNLKTGQTWIDFVPLRFFKGLNPISIAAKSTENNMSASLNGFVIYPDGNSQFFAVADNGKKTLYVPSFGCSDKYILSFSGATVEGELSKSTEMFYTVVSGSIQEKEVKIPSSLDNARIYYQFGEFNDTEKTSFYTDSDFEAYLGDGDIDFFSMYVDCEEVTYPSGKILYSIAFETEKGIPPETIYVEDGAILTATDLPMPSFSSTIDGYTFSGWYYQDTKIESGYVVSGNMKIKAKWKPVVYSIEYELNGGTNSTKNLSSYTVENDTIVLYSPTREGYIFKGWYDNQKLRISEISAKFGGDIKLTADWELSLYKIHYNLNEGEFIDDVKNSYTILDSFNLPIPKKDGYAFMGWYTDSECSGIAVESVVEGSYGELNLYAQWQVGICISSESISDLNLSSVEGDYIIKVIGEISQSNLITISQKFINADSNSSITLDLSSTTGLIAISSNDSQTAIGCYGKLNTLILPNTITTIGNYAFYNNKIKKIIIPESVKTIGDYAFAKSELKDIVLCGVDTIGTKAFYGCTNLITVKLENIKTIGDYAFSNDSQTKSKLELIEIVGVDILEDYVFSNNTEIKNVILKKINKIGYGVFKDCVSLQSVVLDTLAIGSKMFCGCSSLYSVSLQNVSNVGNYSFEKCTSLISIEIDAESIDYSAFKDCSSLTAVTMGKRMKKIYNRYSDAESTSYFVFDGCSSLTSVTFLDQGTWYNAWAGNIIVTNAATNASKLTNISYKGYWTKN